MLGYKAERLEQRINELVTKNAQMKASLTSSVKGNIFDRISASAKKCFTAIDNGSKKSSKSMGSTGKAFSNILLSMVAFQAIFKATEFVGEGFKNLVQYSSELNDAFSDLQSQTATLKNSLATAFAPVVQQIIPYLTKLVEWLNKAMDYLAQFWAVLSGKSTYTRAKKQIVDYAKSLEDASKSAKGALASFDEINVLNKDTGTSGSGELTGANAFEEAEVDESKFEWLDWVRENLDHILYLVGAIALGFLAWKIGGFITELSGLSATMSQLAGIAIAVGGAVLLFTGAFDALENGVDWTNLTQMLLGVVTVVGGLTLAFGATGAAIGAIIGGVTLLVVGIKDIITNGVNLKNGIMVVLGVFMSLVSFVGSAIAGIVAAVAALILCIIADWDNFLATVWEPMKVWFSALKDNFSQVVDGVVKIIDGLQDFVTGVFTGNWKEAWNGIVGILEGVSETIDGIISGVVNIVIGLINTVINCIAGIWNAVASALNQISFEVPDWVPDIGGETIGINLPKFNTENYQIPYLATGGTVTSATLANLGENGRKEVVLPLEQNTEWADILSDKISARSNVTQPVILELDGTEVGRVFLPLLNAESNRVGVSLLT